MPSTGNIPSWLEEPQAYEPLHDRSTFAAKSMLSVAAVLRQLRLDDGHRSPFSPIAPVKLALALGATILNSLSTNLMFTLVLLAFVLVRAALLPRTALARTVAVAGTAGVLAFALALPAALLGQPASAVRLGMKALVSTGFVMEVALTTPAGDLTYGLRAFHVPSIVIMTLDLALRNIVRLGETALEILTALLLRSVGRDSAKQASLGGVGGSLLVKSARAAQDTYDAMRCRCFDGEYDGERVFSPKAADAIWIAAFALLIVLFLHLEGII